MKRVRVVPRVFGMTCLGIFAPVSVAPDAGATTAIYGWYPGHYDAKNSMRMGDYALLAAIGGNIARDFLYVGADSAENAPNH